MRPPESYTVHPLPLSTSDFIQMVNTSRCSLQCRLAVVLAAAAGGAPAASSSCSAGAGDGDDEYVSVDLAKVPADVDKIVLAVTIHDAEARKQNFGRVNGAYVKVYNDETGEELAQYDLDADYSDKTALQFGSLDRKDGEWRFQAVGAGFKLNLATFIRKLGGTV